MRSILVWFALWLGTAHGKACEGSNLPKDAPLRIGKKYTPDKCEKRSKPGDKLSMHYTGTLYSDCTKFDSSRDRNEPFSFTLGQGEVIKGWDDGLRGMCIGEKRKLTIPSDLAYGDEGSGEKIPGGSTLQFDVEVRASKAGHSNSAPPRLLDRSNVEPEEACLAHDAYRLSSARARALTHARSS
jgi:FK506-binding protein 2